MAISFNFFPRAWRKTGLFVEHDNSGANSGATPPAKVLVLGQRAKNGTLAALTKSDMITSEAKAKSYFGRGSMLHRMLRAMLGEKLAIQIYAIGIDDATGAQATGAITYSGAATAAGTHHLYIGASALAGDLHVSVAKSATASEVAASVKAAINNPGDELTSGSLTIGAWYEITARSTTLFTGVGAAANTVGTIFCATGTSVALDSSNKVRQIQNDLAVLASIASGTPTRVDLVAKHVGTLGNKIDIRTDYYGPMGGESPVDGITYSITAMSGGTNDPDISDAIAAIGKDAYHLIINPYALSGQLDDLEAELATRWDALHMLYGHCVTAAVDTQGSLSAFGITRNDPACTVIGCYDTPTPPEEIAASAGSVIAYYTDNDPARGLHTLALKSALAPRSSEAFTPEEANALLYDGISPLVVSGSSLVLDKVVTTYQSDANGNEDDSYLRICTRYTLAAIAAYLRTRVQSAFPRYKLVSDSTPIPAGHAACAPRDIKAEIVAGYLALCERVLVQDPESFKASLLVEIDATNPDRVNVSMQPILAGQLEVIAIKDSFRLITTEAA